MKILIIAHFIQTPTEKGNNRFNYIANILGENKNLNVELITTDFSHKYKRKRKIENEEKYKLNYKLTMLNEPGYKKNVSLRRFYSHFIFSQNVKRYLKNIKEKVDVIYCAVPSLSVAKQVAKYTKKNNIRFIIDIQDLWPEAFKMVFNIPVVSNLLFLPMKKEADFIYKSANEIVAVSETYATRATTVNTNYKNKLCVYLGTDLEKFDTYKNQLHNLQENKYIKLVYIGTLGHSYNLKIVIDALKLLQKEKIENIEFVVMGDGPLKEKFEKYAKAKEVRVRFLGRLPYEEMVKELCRCDIAVNPISHNAAQSIINKVGDYAAAGLPVINTQENPEYRKIVEQYNIGFNCKNDEEKDIADTIKKLMQNKELRIKMGKNNRRLAEEKFDRKITYKDIINLITREK